MNRRSLFPAGLASGLALALVLGSGGVRASDPTSPIIAVLEDWELHLYQPDVATHCPQVTTCMSPHGSIEDFFFAVHLNHAPGGQFRGGGFEVSLYLGGEPYSYIASSQQEALSDASDVVRWTQVMGLHENQLKFTIINGHAADWGDFGGNSYVLAHPSYGSSDLSGYSPATSLNEAGIGFGANRVSALRMPRVRLIRADGTVETITME